MCIFFAPVQELAGIYNHGLSFIITELFQVTWLFCGVRVFSLNPICLWCICEEMSVWWTVNSVCVCVCVYCDAWLKWSFVLIVSSIAWFKLRSALLRSHHSTLNLLLFSIKLSKTCHRYIKWHIQNANVNRCVWRYKIALLCLLYMIENDNWKKVHNKDCNQHILMWTRSNATVEVVAHSYESSSPLIFRTLYSN